MPQDMRPDRNQPFYHLLAENGESSYIAYVSQQNLLFDDSEEPVDHPAIGGLFSSYLNGRYMLRSEHRHRSEEHTSELQSLMRISYAVFCLKKKKNQHTKTNIT